MSFAFKVSVMLCSILSNTSQISDQAREKIPPKGAVTNMKAGDGLQRTWVGFPAPTGGSTQPSVAPVPGDLMPSSD